MQRISCCKNKSLPRRASSGMGGYMAGRRLMLLLTLAVVGAGCARPPRPRVDRLYEGLKEYLPPLRPSMLSGRTILIDPGHGGRFRGTRGPKGLEEADVNLGVSLYLAGLLKEAGADAYLTRSADRDFLAPGDSTVAADLRARAALADSFRPDAFVSIHHNAHHNGWENGVETYYRFGDPPSRDLAYAVHRHMMRNLGIDEGEVRQGNYFLLRAVKATAILTEASYLTHPAVEGKLKLAEKQRLEAESIFLGLVEYFSRGTPKARLLQPVDSVLTSPPTVIFRLVDEGGIGIDPDGITMTLNGRQVYPLYREQSGTVSYRLAPSSPNGQYRVALSTRNLRGNSSPVAKGSFVLSLPPQEAFFQLIPRERGAPAKLRVRLVDERGFPVAEGAAVELERSWTGTPLRTRVKNGIAEFSVILPEQSRQAEVTVWCRGVRFKHSFSLAARAGGGRRIFLVDARSRQPVTGALVFMGDSLLINGSSTGFYHIPAALTPPPEVRAHGYEPSQIPTPTPDTLTLKPWFDGALLGRRILIDPEGSGGQRAGRGPMGLDGSFVNLQVARYLASYLTLAGAEVKLTRRDEQTPLARDVVAMANSFAAERYLEIRHRNSLPSIPTSVRAFYYPGSTVGEEMASRVGSALAQALGNDSCHTAPAVTYALQQTACPAVTIEAPSLQDADEEARLSRAWYLRLQAYAIFLGLVRHFGFEDGGQVEVRLPPGRRGEGWLVGLDGTWRLLTSEQGTATYLMVEPGEHRIELRRGGRRLEREISLEPGEKKIVLFEP